MGLDGNLGILLRILIHLYSLQTLAFQAHVTYDINRDVGDSPPFDQSQ
jgi:hypothetical protein